MYNFYVHIPEIKQPNLELTTDHNENLQLTINLEKMPQLARRQIVKHQIDDGGRDILLEDGAIFRAEYLQFVSTLPDQHQIPVVKNIVSAMSGTSLLKITETRDRIYLLKGLNQSEAAKAVTEQEKWPHAEIVIFSIDEKKFPQTATYKPHIFKKNNMLNAKKHMIDTMTEKGKTVAIREIT